MSELIESVERTIQLVQTRIHDLERQLVDQKKAVNTLCGLLGKPAMYEIDGAATSSIEIVPDEFYGKKLRTAIRVILEKRRASGQGAATLDDLVDALVKGGYHFDRSNDENSKRGVYNTLSKNAGVFHKLPNGRYGLLEWYPHTRTGGTDHEPDEMNGKETLDGVPPHQHDGSPNMRAPHAPFAAEAPPAAPAPAPTAPAVERVTKTKGEDRSV